jgi:hypothetical protein
MSPSAGFVYVLGWEKFQHPDAVRSGHMPWVKLYTDLLGNDDWLELSPADRTLLNGLWMLTGRYGNGRLRADSGHLNARLKIRKGSLDRLKDAGFIEIRASKSARPDASNRAGLDKDRDVGSIEPTKTKSVASSARRNGAARKHQKHLVSAIATATSWIADEPRHLVERSVRETWPEDADTIIARLPHAPEPVPNGSNPEPPAAEPVEISEDDIPF